jgi:hypothetical protein
MFAIPSGNPTSDAGRQSDSNSSHPKNASDSMFSRFDPDSKTTEDKFEQSLKQSLPMKRTVRGIKIDLSDEQLPSTASWISISRDADSNVTAERDEQPKKHFLERISTDAGIQMDRRDEQP